MTRSDPPALDPSRATHALRELCRLIARERRPHALADRACRVLVGSAGFADAWIAIFDPASERTEHVASAPHALDGAAVDALRRGAEGENCLRRVLAQAAPLLTRSSTSPCQDCSLDCNEGGGDRLWSRVCFEQEPVGVLSVALPPGWGERMDVHEFVADFAEELGFGLAPPPAAEDELASAFHLAPVMMAISRVEDGRILEVNEAFVRFTGFSREQLLASNAVELQFLTREARADLVEALKSREQVDGMRVEGRRADGQPLHLRYSGRIIEFQGSRCVLSVCEDISATTVARRAVRDDADLGRAARSIARVGWWRIDHVQGHHHWSEEACDIFGVPSTFQPTDRRLLELVHPDDRDAVSAALDLQHDHVEIEYRVLKADTGETRFVHHKGVRIRDAAQALLRSTGMVQDITERRRRERVKEARLRLNDLPPTDRADALRAILDEAEAITDSKIGFFHDVQDGDIELQVWSSRTTGAVCGVEGIPGHYPVSEAGVWVDALHERAPVVHNDYQSLPHKKGMPEGHASLVRELVVPVIRQDQVVALLGVGNKRTLYEDADVAAVQELAELAWETVARARAEEALQHSEARCRMLFDNMASGVAVYEPTDDGEDFVFVDMNQAGLRFGKTTLEAIVGRRVSEVFPSVREMGLLEVFRRVNRTGEPEVLPMTEYRDDEISMWLENSVLRLPSGLLVSIYEDQSEHRRLQADRERLRQAIEQAAETVVITDRAGLIQYVNPAFERLTGYSRDEALGQNPRILQSGQHDEGFYAEMWEKISGGAVWRGRIVNRRKDETLFTEEAVISPIRNPAGMITSFVAVKRDITKETELEAQLQQAGRLEAIGQLTGGIAHDFNNLLQVINGATEIALLDLASDHPARAELREVAAAGSRASALVKQLLLFSQRQMLQPQVLDLHDVVSHLLKMVSRIIGERVELEWRPAPEGLMVRADRSMVEQCIVNLCVNARDAMPGGGRLRIETRATEVTSVEAGALGVEPGRYVVLGVHDSGEGMDARTRASIFEPFFTTKPSGKGTGLGLATVHRIMERHRGAIRLRSEVGQGAYFELFWPSAEDLDAAVDMRDLTEDLGGTERILLAEDDPMVRAVATKMLQRSGYEVVSAGDGIEAIERYEAEPDRIDLVILDAVMPRLGGIEAHARLVERWPEARVLIASGYSEAAIQSEALDRRDVTVLRKPFRLAQLLGAVRAILDRAP